MIFIVRTESGKMPPLETKMVRKTPAIVPDSGGKTDYFCLGDPETAKAEGLPVAAVHDGWYADDSGGGMAIWGQGMFWEVRDTPFSVRQACGPEAWPVDLRHDRDALVNVRQAIFRG
jgi:hypothetical protein